MPGDCNPFATRFTRPGAIEFLLPPSESLEGLVERLRCHRWWGQIVGPHGSGKSTLLAALQPKLAAAGREIVVVALRPEKGRPDRIAGAGAARAAARASGRTTLLLIDGYERLPGWSRCWVKTWCRLRGAGLLVTAHADVGLPLLFQTQPTVELARQVVARVLPPGDARISEADVRAAWEQHPHNVREVLFSLYDLWQQRE